MARRLTSAVLTLLNAGWLLAAREASAEVFSYTDRAGHVHSVTVHAEPGTASEREEAPAAATPPPSAPSGPARPPAGDVLLVQPAPAPAVVAPAAEAAPDITRVPYYALLQEAARSYSLPVELLVAVAQVESGFNPRATSRRGAQGLMQLMPATAATLGVLDAFDPKQNVMGGSSYLRSLINQFEGQVSLAVAAYNAGAGAVRRAGGIPPLAETQAYVPAVMNLYHAYLAARPGP
jgi:soluble lytic murein transglycosylase-like protein